MTINIIAMSIVTCSIKTLRITPLSTMTLRKITMSKMIPSITATTAFILPQERSQEVQNKSYDVTWFAHQLPRIYLFVTSNVVNRVPDGTIYPGYKQVNYFVGC
jgi:hypothetical protein